MIDLRSDTVSRPTEPMRAVMAAADVGDDVYGEDPTVRRLEETVADLFGKQAALFTPTGSMANLLAVRLLAGVGEEVLCSATAHIARAELGAHAAFTGLTMRTWGSDPVDLAALRELVAPDLGPFFVTTRAVSIENSHNFSGGRVIGPDELAGVGALVEAHRLRLHVDGARIWNAHVALGVPLAALAPGEVLTVCLSKGLGAPVGSLVVGTAEAIAESRIWRKRLGGGMRQVGILAAAGLYALEHHLDRLAEDHEHARLLAAACGVDPAGVDTNIVVVPHPDPASVVAAAAEHGVRLSAVGPTALRLVTHLDVTRPEVDRAAVVLGRLLGS